MKRVMLLMVCVPMLFAAAPADWSSTPDAPESSSSTPEDDAIRLRLGTEFGLLGILSHTYQQGMEGDLFDFRDEGGQDLLFPFLRLSAEIAIQERHKVTFLFQPLALQTKVNARRDIQFDQTTFTDGTPLDIKYGFNFFRANYLYDLIEAPDLEIGVGGGFQMRIADIEFTSADGTQRQNDEDLGPVPLLRFRVRKDFQKWWFATEWDGFYANIPIVNGSVDTSVEGLFLDGNIRAGYKLSPSLDAFLNLRYLGGGGQGTSPSNAEMFGGDGFTANWINAMSVTLGFYFEPAWVL